MQDSFVKIGTVDSVNEYRVKVRFKGQQATTTELTVLDNTSILEDDGERYTKLKAGGSGYAEYEEHRHAIPRWVPRVGQKVVCLMIQNGNGQGFVIGAI